MKEHKESKDKGLPLEKNYLSVIIKSSYHITD